MPFLPLFTGIRHLAQRTHCTHNKSVTTLRYTRRHGPVYTGHACRHLPSAVPWISEDRLLTPLLRIEFLMIMSVKIICFRHGQVYVDSNPGHHVQHAVGDSDVQRHPHGPDGRLLLIRGPGSYQLLPPLEAGRHVRLFLLLLLAHPAGRYHRKGLFVGGAHRKGQFDGQGGQEKDVKWFKNGRKDERAGVVNRR